MIVAKGADDLTLAHIAEVVGLTKAGILHYFTSMNELVKAIVDWCDDRYVKAYLEMINTTLPYPGRTPEVYLQTTAEIYGDGTKQQDAVAAALYASGANASLVTQTYLRSYDRLKADCYADGGDIAEALSIIMAFDALCLGTAFGHRLSSQEQTAVWTNLQKRIEILKG